MTTTSINVIAQCGKDLKGDLEETSCIALLSIILCVRFGVGGGGVTKGPLPRVSRDLEGMDTCQGRFDDDLDGGSVVGG